MKDQITGKILIIDDDEGVVHTMVRLIEELDLEVDAALTLKQGLNKVFTNGFDVVLLDVNLPDGNGIEVIDDILGIQNPPQIIIMTAYSDPDGAELAIESGAWDYIQKPASSRDIRLQVLRALKYQEQKKQSQVQTTFESGSIIGTSKSIRQCLAQAAQIANSDANVLISGETGTGKELFATAIHENSARRNGSFEVVDCSILSENFIESVLFGHEKGAFTGADKKRNGLVSLANGGTLFLDEVGELPESIQASFLRVLQEKTFRPVGSEQEIFSDFRVICATNRNLDQMVDDRSFRMDLLYRLRSFVLELPPLRKRHRDIATIAASQIGICCRRDGIPVKEMSPDFIEALEKYDWPGNVRELVNTLETCLAASAYEKILFAFHLPQKIRAQITRAAISRSHPAPVPEASSALPAEETMSYKEWMDKTEKQYLESLYASARGNIQKIIQTSGISRAVLYRKLKKHQIK